MQNRHELKTVDYLLTCFFKRLFKNFSLF